MYGHPICLFKIDTCAGFTCIDRCICFCFSLADIDECSRDTYPCDTNANCTNSIGSFSCNCHIGYSGSGTTCEGKEV